MYLCIFINTFIYVDLCTDYGEMDLSGAAGSKFTRKISQSVKFACSVGCSLEICFFHFIISQMVTIGLFTFTRVQSLINFSFFFSKRATRVSIQTNDILVLYSFKNIKKLTNWHMFLLFFIIRIETCCTHVRSGVGAVVYTIRQYVVG